jgi:hypothetical protein
LIDRFENVATPFTALSRTVPDRVPELGLVPMATVIEVVALVTTLPLASSTLTATAGVIEEFRTVLLGWVVNTSLEAVPAVMVTLLDAGDVRLGLVVVASKV